MRILKLIRSKYVVISIWHQIFVTYLQENVEQLEERINKQILGVKGLIQYM